MRYDLDARPYECWSAITGSVVCRHSHLTIYAYLSVCLTVCQPVLRHSIHLSVYK